MAPETTTGTEPRLEGGVARQPDAEFRRQAYRRPVFTCHGSLQDLTHLEPVAENFDGQFGSTPGT